MHIIAQALESGPLFARFGYFFWGRRLGNNLYWGQYINGNAIGTYEQLSRFLGLQPGPKEYETFSYLCENMALAHARVFGKTMEAPLLPSPTYKAYIETYGCQMNFADSELVAGILHSAGYGFTTQPEEADLVLINTCAIREHAEEKIWQRLKYFQSLKRRKPHLMVGVLGCMAERLRKKLIEEAPVVDMVVGPDSYRHLPQLIRQVEGGTKAIHTLLSREETYADIAPLRLSPYRVSAYISIMRGCNNMCSFCIVPFTRGRERSRSWQTIVEEARQLADAGYKEITLLGQNVDSYNDNGVRFAQLLAAVAEAVPEVWIRFATSHPKDMLDEVLEVIATYPNLTPYIHLPVQSGSNTVLQRMNRGYTAEWYLQRIETIRKYLPEAVVSTDIIVGFCGETEEEFQDTLALMRAARFDSVYQFMYSERPGTLAARRYADDIPPAVKQARLEAVIELAQALALESNTRQVGTTQTVLLEKPARRNPQDMAGRTFSGRSVIVREAASQYAAGDRIPVRITEATSATLIGYVAHEHARCA